MNRNKPKKSEKFFNKKLIVIIAFCQRDFENKLKELGLENKSLVDLGGNGCFMLKEDYKIYLKLKRRRK